LRENCAKDVVCARKLPIQERAEATVSDKTDDGEWVKWLERNLLRVAQMSAL
jgi:hypothetical protein